MSEDFRNESDIAEEALTNLLDSQAGLNKTLVAILLDLQERVANLEYELMKIKEPDSKDGKESESLVKLD